MLADIAASKADADPKVAKTPSEDSDYLVVTGVISPADSSHQMPIFKFAGYVTPMGEDMRPMTSSESGSLPDAVVPRGELVPFSQSRLKKEENELKQAMEVVAELNPARNGKAVTLVEINRWADRHITQDARERKPCASLHVFWVDPENIRKARKGPGTQVNDRVYRKLAHARLAAKTEEHRPETSSQDDGDDDDDDDVSDWTQVEHQLWLRQLSSAPEYHGQWTSYQASPPRYPIVKDGVLSLLSSAPRGGYGHKSIQFKVENPKAYEQHEFQPNFGFWPEYHLDPQHFRDQFFLWIRSLPEPGKVVDIHHAAFFDGTSCPDGASSMIIMKDKHRICTRHDDDEQTRLHWHETAAGYSWNFGTQMKAKAIIRLRESQRIMAARGTLEPSTQRLHHYLVLRPCEPDDADDLIALFNWYAENTTFLPRDTPITKPDILQLIQLCRERSLPFVVAVPDTRIKVYERRPDEPPILGFAYVRRFNDEELTGEVRVFVDRTCTRLRIGTALLDLIMRTCDANWKRDGPRPYDFIPQDGLEYGEAYQCNVTSLVFSIAYEPSRDRQYAWVRQWLSRRFGFVQLGHIKDGRVKFGYRYVFAFILMIPSARC